ncbi:hypothetical protein ACIOHA_17695 [Streptomyces anulatus]
MAFEGSVSPESEPYVIALRDWLASEDVLRGRVQIQRQPPLPGHMGSTMELLTVSLGSGGILAVLIQSVCTWPSSRGTDINTLPGIRTGQCLGTMWAGAQQMGGAPKGPTHHSQTSTAPLHGKSPFELDRTKQAPSPRQGLTRTEHSSESPVGQTGIPRHH